MNYEGKITHIGSIETVWDNLQKRTVVLEEITDREFKGGIAFDLLKDKTTIVDSFKVWDSVKVWLNFRTNYSENTNKYYTSITCWNMSMLSNNNQSEDNLPF